MVNESANTRHPYRCKKCCAGYSTETGAYECSRRGLPRELEKGTMFKREGEIFIIAFLSGRVGYRTHERRYAVVKFPEERKETLRATANFYGQELHAIEKLCVDGRFVQTLPHGPAIKLTELQVNRELEREDFRNFYNRVMLSPES